MVTNNVVDLLNLISIKSGYSIGGYDFNKIKGDISLSIGNETDDYDAIGRGKLNINHLPVLRDNMSAFGTPTSDSTRTCIDATTREILFVFYNFGNHNRFEEVLVETETLLQTYAQATNIIVTIEL